MCVCEREFLYLHVNNTNKEKVWSRKKKIPKQKGGRKDDNDVRSSTITTRSKLKALKSFSALSGLFA